MVYCADCGRLMYLCRSKSHTAEQEHLKCSSYANNQEVCSAHFVRTAVLRKIVLAELNGIMHIVKEHEDEFIKMALNNSTQQQSAELKNARKQLSQAERRIAEIDRLFIKLYEGKEERLCERSHSLSKIISKLLYSPRHFPSRIFFDWLLSIEGSP